MSSRPALRVEYALAEYGDSVAAVLAVLGVVLLGAAAVVAAGGLPTTTEQRATDVEEFSTNLTTNATVTRDSALYEPGTVLTDEGIYFLSASPEVRVTARSQSPTTSEVTFAHGIRLVLEAVREEETIWTRNRTLSEPEAGPTTAELNVSAFRTETREPVASELPGDASLRVYLAVETRYDSGTYEGSYTDRLRLVVREGSYEFDRPLGSTETRRTESTERVVDSQRVTRFPFAGPVGNAALVRLAAGVFLLVGSGLSAYGHLNSRHRRRIARQLEQSQYNEWISPGELSDVELDESVELSTLQGIIDVAIDTDRRVIHDDDVEQYAVFTDKRTYVYTPETAAPETDTSEESAASTTTDSETSLLQSWRTDLLSRQTDDEAGPDSETSDQEDADSNDE